jgi:hypothetical protein
MNYDFYINNLQYTCTNLKADLFMKIMNLSYLNNVNTRTLNFRLVVKKKKNGILNFNIQIIIYLLLFFF